MGSQPFWVTPLLILPSLNSIHSSESTSGDNHCLDEELQNSKNSNEAFEKHNASLPQDAQGEDEGPTRWEVLFNNNNSMQGLEQL
jgi:hypothetical protein